MHTLSQDPATPAQIKLCNDLMAAGASFDDPKWLEKNPTKEQCSEFIRANSEVNAKLKKARGHKRYTI